MSKKIFRWPVRVYFEDTDAGGVVYHAQYLAFYERARTEVLREQGYNQQKLYQERIAFVVRRMEMEFILPARLDDLLEVQSKVVAMRGASLTFQQRLVNENGTVLNQAEILIACIDPVAMKPIALPEFVSKGFK